MQIAPLPYGEAQSVLLFARTIDLWNRYEARVSQRGQWQQVGIIAGNEHDLDSWCKLLDVFEGDQIGVIAQGVGDQLASASASALASITRASARP